MTDTVIALSRTPGLLNLGDREFVVLPPTPRDMLATTTRMKELAQAQCLTPVEYVLKYHSHLPAAALALCVREAIALGSGSGDSNAEAKGREPSPELVWKQYTTLEGVRWRVWYHVSRVLKEFAPKDAEPLVTADNLLDASDALDAAINFAAIDPEKKTPPTGTPS